MTLRLPGFLFLILVLIVPILCGCGDDEAIYSPKPRGFVKINFPEKNYRVYDSLCPYSFEIPIYSRMEQDDHKGAEPCWQNLQFPQFRATIHLSYKQVHNDLKEHLENSHYFANKHQVKATGLDEIAVLRDSARVYGLLFDISGNTASSLQFYLTDSTKHFLRGALYFNSTPNADSLQVVINYLRTDILHLINTTRWKNDVRYPKK